MPLWAGNSAGYRVEDSGGVPGIKSHSGMNCLVLFVFHIYLSDCFIVQWRYSDRKIENIV